MRAGFEYLFPTSVDKSEERAALRVRSHMAAMSSCTAAVVPLRQAPELECIAASRAREGRACTAGSSVTCRHRVPSCVDACVLPRATCRLTIVPSWFCSWREVDLRSLKGNPDEENEEVMARLFCLRDCVHMWVQSSRGLRPVGGKCKLAVLLVDWEGPGMGWSWLKVVCPLNSAGGRGQRGSVKLLCYRSRTCPTPPSPPCTPNVRRWRGLGGCGPQVCRPSGGAAGDGTGSWGPHHPGTALPLWLFCSHTGRGWERRVLGVCWA